MKMEVHKTATILLLVIENFGLRTMLSKRYSSFVLSLLLVHHSHSVLRSASSVNIIFYIFVGAGTRRGLFENAKGVTPLSRFFDMSSPPRPLSICFRFVFYAFLTSPWKLQGKLFQFLVWSIYRIRKFQIVKIWLYHPRGLIGGAKYEKTKFQKSPSLIL